MSSNLKAALVIVLLLALLFGLLFRFIKLENYVFRKIEVQKTPEKVPEKIEVYDGGSGTHYYDAGTGMSVMYY